MKLLLVLFVALCYTGEGQNESRIIYTSNAPKPIGPYSQGILAGNTVFVSGQIGLKSDGTLDSTSIENETRQVITNIKFVLEAASMELKHVVKTTIYLTDLHNFKTVNEILGPSLIIFLLPAKQ